MAFSSTQLRALKRELKASHIRTRQSQGRELSYIEGWHAIMEANRIFGFDAWSRETIESKCVLSREIRGSFHVVYVAKVRITVRAEEHIVIREGFGAGEAQCPTLGEAHDKAIKTAETDATKRALATFGRPFGLALYLGHKPKARHSENDTSNPPIERRRTLQRLGANGRYYVPRRPITPIDPLLAAHESAASFGRSGSAPKDVTATDAEASDVMESAGAHPTSPAPVGQSTALAPSPPAHGDGKADGAKLLLPRTPRRREPAHLRFVASQPCLVCGRRPSDAHHLRFAQPRALGRKVSDEFTVPLCRTHHRQVHQTGDELQWWLDIDIDPLPIARNLWDDFQERSKGSETLPASVEPSPLSSKG
jgi:hypothetical protein